MTMNRSSDYECLFVMLTNTHTHTHTKTAAEEGDGLRKLNGKTGNAHS